LQLYVSATINIISYVKIHICLFFSISLIYYHIYPYISHILRFTYDDTLGALTINLGLNLHQNKHGKYLLL